MAAKSSLPQELPKPNLTVSQTDAKGQLSKRVDLGKEIFNLGITSKDQLKEARSKRNKWHDFNKELLGDIFSNEKIAKEYETKSRGGFVSLGYSSLQEDVDDFRDGIAKKIEALESVIERLSFFKLPAEVQQKAETTEITDRPNLDSVFVVHGHDELTKSKVTSFLKDLGVKPIVLNDEPNKGKTIIEKLEYYSDQASFAIVLLTPDDLGRTKEAKEERGRARQNVILELGYFIGKFGRDNTCALYKHELELPDLELPSDYSGVVYTPMDDGESWKFSLAKELKEAGFKIDLNRAI